MKNRLHIFLFTFILAAAAQPARAADEVSVFVSIVPQQYFLQQIGKDRVKIQVMVLPGANPATYEPKPAQMAALSTARIYFAIGVPFENTWLPKISAANPKMTVVHTDTGIQKLSMAAHHHFDATVLHEKEGHALENGRDPHIWLSPPLVKIQVEHIVTALQRIDPEHAAAYRTNGLEFMDRINRLDAELKQVLAGKQGLQFMVFHPAWGYFAHTYGLRQVPIEIEGKAPKPAQLQTLIEHARKNDINVIFVQPQFSTRNAELVAREIGGRVIAADPLAADWMDNLKNVAEKFNEALR